MNKRYLALLMSVVLLFSCFVGTGAFSLPLSSGGSIAFAPDDSNASSSDIGGGESSSSDLTVIEGPWEYKPTEEGAVIVFYYGEESDVTVPRTLGDKPVIGIENNVFYDATFIIVPNTVKTVSDAAFFGRAVTVHGAPETEAQRLADRNENITFSEEHLYEKTTVQPTCTEQGYTDYECPCGVSFRSDYTESVGHTIVIDERIEPTCTEPGLTEGSHCSVCSEVLTAQLEIQAYGHNFVSDPAVEPTCEMPGKSSGEHCTRCGLVTSPQIEVPARGHKIVVPEVIQPTCAAPGSIGGAYCEVCGKVIIEPRVVPAVGHHYEVETTAIVPDCTNPGRTECIRCTVCGETVIQSKEIPALGHLPATVPGFAAACGTEGLTAGSICSVCGEVLTEQQTIPATGHNPVTIEAVEATCISVGFTEGTYCSYCGEMLTERTLIPATGHTIVTDEAISADCVTDGLTEGKHCTVCETVFLEQKTVPSKGHVTVVTCGYPATCTTDGLSDGIRCVVCGTILSEQTVIPAKGHQYVTMPAVEPTYVSYGYSSYEKCSGCGDVPKQPEKIPMLEFNDGVVVTEKENNVVVDEEPDDNVELFVKRIDDEEYKSDLADSLNEHSEPLDNEYLHNDIAVSFNLSLLINGVESQIPEGSSAYVTLDVGKEEAMLLKDGLLSLVHVHDGVPKEIDIDKIDTEKGTVSFYVTGFSPFCLVGHIYHDETVKPTCGAKGYVLHTCDMCGQSYADAFTDARGHEFGEFLVYTAPTDTEKGEERRFCLHEGCTQFESRSVPPIGHTYQDTVVQPTCSSSGYTVHECKNCPDYYIDSLTPATNHTYGEWQEYEKPTETTSGLNVRICSECGLREFAKVNPIGHVHAFIAVDSVAATCTEIGYALMRCPCGETQQVITKFARGHALEKHAAVEPTCERTGNAEYYTCSVCDYSTYNELPMKEHVLVLQPGYAPDCTNEGMTDGWFCEACENVIVARESIPAKGHTEEPIAPVAPTCTANGNTEGLRCSDCGAILRSAQTVPARGHIETTLIGQPATCQTMGITDGKACAVCGEILQAQTILPKADHSYAITSGRAATCTENGITAGAVCSVCGEVLIEQQILEARGHHFEDGVCIHCGEVQAAENPFSDVRKKDWFYPYVMDTYTKGLFSGYTDGTFRPSEDMSRAMIVVVLHRLNGEPEPTGTNPFSDAKAKWYKNAVIWGAENGIVAGFPDGTFRPDDQVTREMAAAIMYRYAQFKGRAVTESADLNQFRDAKKVGKWARTSVSWAIGANLISGVSENGVIRIAPQDSTSRAMFATILSKFVTLIGQ